MLGEKFHGCDILDILYGIEEAATWYAHYRTKHFARCPENKQQKNRWLERGEVDVD
jgi:hypothetical protein